MTSLKQKTISGLLWSFMDSFATQGITFVVGIILARLLSPREFGLIGMITVFIAISSSFINSGFGNALIRKQNCTEKDFSTVFYFNLVMGGLFFWILFFSAPAISRFFNEPQLKHIVQVLSFVLIIDSLTIIQRTILTKRIDYKLQTKISIISSIISGTVGLIMAFNGFGVWSLVAKQISQQAINSLLLWTWNRWRPLLVFSTKSFQQLFSFGYKLLISGLIDTLYINLYFLIIGKYFSAQELGFYTRADHFKSLPSSNLQGIIGRVSYPVLASIQDDIPRLRESYKKLIRSTMLISFIMMLCMAAIARPMILSLIGEKWEPSVIYLQMLCFVGMFYPLHALNLNMLQVVGRSDLLLRLEIIKKTLAIPIIVIGIMFGIEEMIFGMIILTLIAYYLNSYWSGTFIGYSFLAQVKDILPSLVLASIISLIVFAEGLFILLPPLPLLIIQLISGVLLTFGICEAIQFKDYIYIKGIITEKFLTQNKG
jgi:O-antigen/teichoic acid export membrane protein